MTRKLVHPLWVHLPALLVLVGALVTANGNATTWLSTYKYGTAHPRGLGVDVITIGLLGLMLIAFSVLGDELWARQETRKTFNWLSLIDEALVGYYAGALIPSASHVALWTLPAGAVAGAVVLELVRPYRPSEQRAAHEDTSALERHIAESKQQGKAWVYWDVQNPWWMTCLCSGAGMGLVSVGILTLRHAPWLAGPLMVFGISILALNGGVVRTLVTSDRVEVRMGVFRPLRMRIADIASADVHTFSPLREFGGYGIRYGHGTKAFFVRGNRGVLLTSTSGKKYLIGSDHPERLAAAINATMGQQIR